MSCLKCRCIVCTVTGNSYNLTALLQSLNQSFLIQRSCTRNNLKLLYTFKKFLIRQFLKLRTSQNILVGVGIFPKTDLTTDFLCSTRSISCDNLDAYAGIHTLSNSSRHIRSHRIRNSCNSEEIQSRSNQLAIIYSLIAILKNLICKSKSTHGLILICKKLTVDILTRYTSAYRSTLRCHNLRCTLHINHTLACNRRLHDSCHILVFSCERNLIHHLGILSHRLSHTRHDHRKQT